MIDILGYLVSIAFAVLIVTFCLLMVCAIIGGISELINEIWRTWK